MMTHEKMQVLAETVAAAQKLLQDKAHAYPSLHSANRALRRVAQAVGRPFRVAILGESNSGKSSIANFIAGEGALPALPVANTRLPTLLHYAPVPVVEALDVGGGRFALTPSGDVALKTILRLDVGLPVETLRRVEILDFPGSANPLFKTDVLAILKHRADAAIWATVATEAWRETERVAWLGLPAHIRKRGLLAVTHCDLIASADDFRKLQARLTPIAEAHFSGLCFASITKMQKKVGAAPLDPAQRTGSALLFDLERLTQNFEAERYEKALEMTHRYAAQAMARLEYDLRSGLQPPAREQSGLDTGDTI